VVGLLLCIILMICESCDEENLQAIWPTARLSGSIAPGAGPEHRGAGYGKGRSICIARESDAVHTVDGTIDRLSSAVFVADPHERRGKDMTARVVSMLVPARLSSMLAVVSALVLSLNGCDKSVPEAVAPPPLPVGVATAERRDVPQFVEMVGTTLGIQDVPIRARVEGFLETMNFREGSFVKKGDLLYTIDAQPFQAKLVEAQSRLATARTNLVKAQSDLARIKPLAEIDAVSQQDLDGAMAQEAAGRSSVTAAEAAVDLARIELSYTRLKAPIDGLIGLSKAKPGEFVGREPNPVVLNVLSDIDPIRVRFSISEREYLILARYYLDRGGRNPDRGDEQPQLTLLLADGSEHAYPGKVVASSQAIDPETGTYSVEAAFPNPEGLLLPGQFARVRAPYKTLENAVVVPRRALSELQGRFQLYVVGAGNKIEVRDVQPGPEVDNMVVIENGLDGGESVVVEGLQKVRTGMTVDPKPTEPAARAALPGEN
jgi:membrane fusion protein (multidrug efflux system)